MNRRNALRSIMAKAISSGICGHAIGNLIDHVRSDSDEKPNAYKMTPLSKLFAALAAAAAIVWHKEMDREIGSGRKQDNNNDQGPK
jgi:hypothetical protein